MTYTLFRQLALGLKPKPFFISFWLARQLPKFVRAVANGLLVVLHFGLMLDEQNSRATPASGVQSATQNLTCSRGQRSYLQGSLVTRQEQQMPTER